MSFIRFAHSRLATRQFARGYSTAPAAKQSNLPYWLLGAGAGGLGIYAYLDSRYSEKPQEKSPLDPQNFLDFKLKKIVPYNHNTSTFIFELPNNDASLIPVASCLIVKSSDPEGCTSNGKPVIRPYTPTSQPDDRGVLELLVKKYDSGNMSKHIHTLKEGDTLAIKGPITKWAYKENEFDEVALIGGGSGITPLWQIVSHALRSPANKTKFTLIYSNVTEADILMREQFEELAKKNPETLKLVYALDKPPKNWSGPSGYITKDLVKEYVAPASLGEKVKVFVCGPPGQMNAISGQKAGMKQGEIGGVLKELGYTIDQVFKF
ncbi:cytochrome-b5 reductase [Cylindrobasidium torrendii FP15055 ss-10]|uniref:NADH-cytochrome b5 reductase n=1 Tax=Cylindrobasidium torrendii FP15055 ss-10 TaxID=1314674 RepID=A0A0D7BUU0_9AGAR|nr:cytochrome-b5 reductase [Cylindrobasidium torrendii FP15055 ss-10]